MIPVAICLIGGGLFYANHRVKEAVGAQVVNLMSQPQGQQEISQLLQQYQSSTGSVGSAGSASGTSKQTKAAGGSLSNGSGGSESSGHSTTGGSGSNRAVGASGGGSQSIQVTTHVTANASSPATSRGVSNKTTQAGRSSGVPTFTSRAQVVQFAMSRFSESEIAHFAQQYAQRQQLSQSQKDQIKAEILSDFSPAELAAMESAAAKYH